MPLTPAEAGALWTDTARWATFIEGFARVLEDRDWPQAGGRLSWESIPEGRGRVLERVTDYVPGERLVTAVNEEQLTATQSVTFSPDPEGAYVELALDYELSREDGLKKIVDVLFIRRALSDALGRTLRRFRTEAMEEADRAG